MARETDPYRYPETDVLRNRLGIADAIELGRHERLITRARGNEALGMDPASTPAGYRALHQHLYRDIYDWAGQDRIANTGERGGRSAHPSYVAGVLDAAFRDVADRGGFGGLDRETFFDRLGQHLNELNAAHPFPAGNGRTMRLHAVQIARDAGHPIRLSGIDAPAWGRGVNYGLATGDHRGLRAALSSAAGDREPGSEARTGPSGIAVLPRRDPPAGQRYRVPLAKVRDELEKHLPSARSEADEQLRTIIKGGGSPEEIGRVRGELAYVRHAKGPIYQSHLLKHLGSREIEAVVSPRQTPLERVREIGAGLAVQINMHQAVHVQRGMRALERPGPETGQSLVQERLAAAFLKNPSENNAADPRFASAQAVVDAARLAARERGEGARAVEAVGEAARKAVATAIRSGTPLDGKAIEHGRSAESRPHSVARDDGRGR